MRGENAGLCFSWLFEIRLGAQLSQFASLRASGSRECAPDDRLREAIHDAAVTIWIASVASLPSPPWGGCFPDAVQRAPGDAKHRPVRCSAEPGPHT